MVPCRRRCATVLHGMRSVAVFWRRSSVMRRRNRLCLRNRVHPPRAAGRRTRARRGRKRSGECPGVWPARAPRGRLPRGGRAFDIGRADGRTRRIVWIVRARIRGRRTSARRDSRQTWRRVGRTMAGDRKCGGYCAHRANLGQHIHRMHHRKLLPHHLSHQTHIDLPLHLQRPLLIWHRKLCRSLDRAQSSLSKLLKGHLLTGDVAPPITH
jgi:hypothetical protein